MRRSWQRCWAVLALVSQLLLCVAAVGLTSSAHCECHHGPEVSCDCPHHAGGDPKSLPPCHRKLLAQRAAKERQSPSPTMKAHCASQRPELLVPMLVEVPRIELHPIASPMPLPVSFPALLAETTVTRPPRVPPPIRVG